MLDVLPLTPDRWDDLVALFGPSGAYGGCWCMWWRVSATEYDEQHGEGLRNRFRSLVEEGPAPGLLGYRDGEPVGWVALGDRTEYGRIERSPKLRAVDDRPVCSVVCFVVARGHRRTGVSTALLEAAVAEAARRGHEVVEGYPIDTSTRPGMRAADLFTGTLDLFTRAGFVEVERRGGRPIVRRTV